MATKRTLEELAEIVNNHLANLQRIGVNWSGGLLERLNDVQSELMAYILSAQKNFGSAGLDSGTNKRLKIIKTKVESLLNQAYSQGYYAISAQAAGLAENEAKHAASLVRAMTGTAVAQVGKRTVENIVKYGRFNGLTLAEMFNSMSVKDADKIYTTVAKNILSGSTPQSLKKAVQHVFDVSNYTAKTVGLTCANGISNDARLATFAQNGDVVKGVEILNSLDGRTCLARGQLIQTPNGKKPIETVKTGDFVIGGSRNRRRVLGTSTKKVKQIVVVTLSNGEKIRCTADHLFLTENKEWKDAGKLRIGERLAESL